MSYYGGTITTAGRDLITKLMTGEVLEFTRVMVGSGKIPEGIEPSDIDELVSPFAEAVSTMPVIENGNVNMTVEYRNDLNGGLNEQFWLNEFGIYAKTDRTDEVLLYYATLGDTPQPVNAYQDGRIDIRRYPVTISLSLNEDVEVKYNPGAFMTASEAVELIETKVSQEVLKVMGSISLTGGKGAVVSEEPPEDKTVLWVDLLDPTVDTNVGGGGNEKAILWSGSAKERDVISLAEDPAVHGQLELVVDVNASSYGDVGITGARIYGGVTEKDYYGESITASGVVMGSGGYPYIFHASITRTEDGWRVNEIRCIRYSASGFADRFDDCTLRSISSASGFSSSVAARANEIHIGADEPSEGCEVWIVPDDEEGISAQTDDATNEQSDNSGGVSVFYWSGDYLYYDSDLSAKVTKNDYRLALNKTVHIYSESGSECFVPLCSTDCGDYYEIFVMNKNGSFVVCTSEYTASAPT